MPDERERLRHLRAKGAALTPQEQAELAGILDRAKRREGPVVSEPEHHRPARAPMRIRATDDMPEDRQPRPDPLD